MQPLNPPPQDINPLPSTGEQLKVGLVKRLPYIIGQITKWAIIGFVTAFRFILSLIREAFNR